MPTTAHTGQRAPQSGIYRPSNGGREIALSEGDVCPPALGQAVDYQLVRPTRR